MAGRTESVWLAVDPHKRMNAVEVVDGPGAVLARRTFAHSTVGFKELLSAYSLTCRSGYDLTCRSVFGESVLFSP